MQTEIDTENVLLMKMTYSPQKGTGEMRPNQKVFERERSIK